jgi:hypothetical protein
MTVIHSILPCTLDYSLYIAADELSSHAIDVPQLRRALREFAATVLESTNVSFSEKNEGLAVSHLTERQCASIAQWLAERHGVASTTNVVSSAPSGYKAFLGNLPLDCTKAELHRELSDFVAPTSIDLRAGRAFNYAIVTLSDAADHAALLGVARLNIRGHMVHILPSSSSGSSDAATRRVLFNCPLDARDYDLHHLLDHSDVRFWYGIKPLPDSRTRRFVVHFASQEAATTWSGTVLDYHGRKLYVSDPAHPFCGKCKSSACSCPAKSAVAVPPLPSAKRPRQSSPTPSAMSVVPTPTPLPPIAAPDLALTVAVRNMESGISALVQTQDRQTQTIAALTHANKALQTRILAIESKSTNIDCRFDRLEAMLVRHFAAMSAQPQVCEQAGDDMDDDRGLGLSSHVLSDYAGSSSPLHVGTPTAP